MKSLRKIYLLIIAALLVACSIEITQDQPTLQSPTDQPGPTVIYGPVPTFASRSAPVSTPAASHKPPAWANLKLSGHLIYVQTPRQIINLDLASGQQTTLFNAPDNAFVSAAQVSPDGKWIVMAYAPPPKDPALQSVNTDLYTLPADGSVAPQVLLQRASDKETFFNPVWSADGQYVYYSHLVPGTGDKYTDFTYALERVAFPGRQPEKLIDHAFWPRLSPDGTKLAYVSFDASTNSNDLFLADVDGRHSRLVMPAGSFYAVDASFFSPDGKQLLFSAVGDVQVQNLSWLDQLLGVQIAEAHNVPSDWWRVPVEGGKP